MSAPGGRRIDDKTVASMRACMTTPASARAVQAAGHANVAYHLATLALEEIVPRELVARGDAQA
jgi:hypothetical protein